MADEKGPEPIFDNTSKITIFPTDSMKSSGKNNGPTTSIIMKNDFREAAPEAVAGISAKLNQLSKTVSKMPQIVATTQKIRPTLSK